MSDQNYAKAYSKRPVARRQVAPASNHLATIAVGLAAVTGLVRPSAGQGPQIVYSLAWTDIGGSFSNGVIEPGESARITLSVSFSPPVGTVISYPPPPPPGTGPVAGLAHIYFDLVPTCGNGGAGVWTLSGPGFNGTTGANWGLRSGWALGGSVGTPQPNGSVLSCVATQEFSGQVVNSSNPVVEIWRAKWTPTNFSGGSVRFTLRPAPGAGPSHSALLVQYGTDPTTGSPQYIYVNVPATFGSVTLHAGYPGGSCFSCYANCDGSFTEPWLNVNDFACFLNRFAAGEAYANCDSSTAPPVLNVLDFACFLNRFAAGCP